MNDSPIELFEYSTKPIPKGEVPDNFGEILWPNYKNQVVVDPPSFKTNGNWQLTSQGWVGYIPLTQELGLLLQPKIELQNIFGMLEYAYRLNPFRQGVWDCNSLKEFYESLANVLAHKILDRGRKGFYRAYIPRNEKSDFIRGRINMQAAIRKPWDAKITCYYEEHTPNISENQILAWTLSRIARSGACTERVLPSIRRAYRELQGYVSLAAYGPDDCIGIRYNRLNIDYQPMHILCRFFLDQTGPTHKIGDQKILPFLIDMDHLYELFVAEWVKQHLRQHFPQHLKLKSQKRQTYGQRNAIIDLVISDSETGEVQYVLDTKYKLSQSPSPDDIHQINFYADITHCHQAILIYPKPLSEPLDEMIRDNRIRSLTFSIDGDLDEAGKSFMKNLFHGVDTNCN